MHESSWNCPFIAQLRPLDVGVPSVPQAAGESRARASPCWIDGRRRPTRAQYAKTHALAANVYALRDLVSEIEAKLSGSFNDAFVPRDQRRRGITFEP